MGRLLTSAKQVYLWACYGCKQRWRSGDLIIGDKGGESMDPRDVPMCPQCRTGDHLLDQHTSYALSDSCPNSMQFPRGVVNG